MGLIEQASRERQRPDTAGLGIGRDGTIKAVSVRLGRRIGVPTSRESRVNVLANHVRRSDRSSSLSAPAFLAQ